MTSGVQIDASDVSVTAGRTSILIRVSLVVKPGEFVGVLGPSGCGKSTLLKTLSGQIRPSVGRVLLDGHAPTGPAARALFGYVPQDDIVHACLKVERALAYSARLRLPVRTPHTEIGARVDEVVSLMELGERRKNRVDSLSGGQRKRVSIGVELLTRPPLLFLDEPTSGLDPALEERLMDLFRSLTGHGRTVLLTTHVLQSVDRLHLVAVMSAGRLAFFGPPSEAPAFFGVGHIQDLYGAIAKDPAGWADRYRASSLYTQLVARRTALR